MSSQVRPIIAVPNRFKGKGKQNVGHVLWSEEISWRHCRPLSILHSLQICTNIIVCLTTFFRHKDKSYVHIPSNTVTVTRHNLIQHCWEPIMPSVKATRWERTVIIGDNENSLWKREYMCGSALKTSIYIGPITRYGRYQWNVYLHR